MRIRQSSYEIVGDCSDKGGHRYHPLHRLILREVMARRRVMFMLRVMTYVVSYKLFWNWISVVQFQVVSHEVFSDKGFVVWHFLYCLRRTNWVEPKNELTCFSTQKRTSWASSPRFLKSQEQHIQGRIFRHRQVLQASHLQCDGLRSTWVPAPCLGSCLQTDKVYYERLGQEDQINGALFCSVRSQIFNSNVW